MYDDVKGEIMYLIRLVPAVAGLLVTAGSVAGIPDGAGGGNVPLRSTTVYIDVSCPSDN